jgi:hypothetical protein
MVLNKAVTALLLLAVAALVPCATAEQIDSDDIAVVVNPQNATKELSLQALRRLYRGEQHSWDGKVPVVLLIRAFGAPEREVALRVVLRMEETEYFHYWADRKKPVVTFSNGTQTEAVASIPGAIALVRARDVRHGIKVLRVDGRLPGQEGYPLR